MVAPTLFEALSARGALGLEEGRAYAAPGDGGYRPLAPVADQRDGVQRISLPRGFLYVNFGVAGTPMSDKNLTPIAHDGMAAFSLQSGNILLIRNHEDRNGPGGGTTTGPLQTKYDALGGGGTTSLEINQGRAV
jgi:secreted PhoX family phosphatase